MLPSAIENTLIAIGEWTAAIIILAAVGFGVALGISALIYWIKQKFKS
jgi:hypothetical protein